ncbi:hypothetical protein [Helicobacter cetorum]|uniref:Uncharacterized protein n=1 Tax=Helicobacter cetorum (strain ATCC BAA-540 / CCUG 52418 / MIT 99-5656) TaxID=1163745 RepID=I0EQJ7_HELCM|nr:hypothetical protein [Helicobacter cetorum]AFI05216.1 hypothetical protein HCD_00920 [Helicobacter cetorum MIT 99-5656]AFI06008.1 hypothetical protein HCD_05030 [Helicobacter cetorum MIT 99-5656]
MKQLVRNVSYMVESRFFLNKPTIELAAIPQGAVIVKCNVEIITPLESGTTTLSVGIKGSDALFLNGIKVLKTDPKYSQFNESNVLYEMPTTQTINANITNPDATNKAEAILRVCYFLPSKIQVEYD